MKTTTGAVEAAQETVTELRPLVEFGCCTVETARLLAAAVLPGEENRS
ncbi:hypothetical protein [Streptomyces sp. NPDC058548]